MSVQNGKVTAPVGLYEVAFLLGENSLDVGSVCSSNNINPFARYKPQKSNKSVPYQPLTEIERSNAQYGFVPKKINSWQELISSYDGGMNGWVYNKPEYYRLTDFINETGLLGYWHHAPKILENVKAESSQLYIEDDNSFTLLYYTSQELNDAVTIDLLFSGYRFGLYFVDNLNYSKKAITCNNNDKKITINKNNIPEEAGNIFTIYPFITNAEYASWGTGTNFKDSYIHYTIPLINPITISVLSLSEAFLINGVLDRPNSLFTITIKNDSIKTCVVKEAYFEILLLTNSVPPEQIDTSAGETSGDLDYINDVTFTPGATYSFSRSTDQSTLSKFASSPGLFQVWVYLSFENAPTVYKRIPIEIRNS